MLSLDSGSCPRGHRGQSVTLSAAAFQGLACAWHMAVGLMEGVMQRTRLNFRACFFHDHIMTIYSFGLILQKDPSLSASSRNLGVTAKSCSSAQA